MFSPSPTGTWQSLENTFQVESNGWTARVSPFIPHASMTIVRKTVDSCSEAVQYEMRRDKREGALESDASNRTVLPDLAGHDEKTVLSIYPRPRHSFLPEEVYVRQGDLIARYAQAEDDQFAFQLDWRLKPVQPPFSLAVEIWVSIQTQLLDTHPSIELRSLGPGSWTSWSHAELTADWSGNSEESSGTPAAMISSSHGASVLWLLDSGDQTQVQWMESSSSERLNARLFGSFLEKGVIRRARWQLLVASARISVSDIKEAYRSLFTSALPLTA